MAYQSLYRRYRPRRFSEIRGQSHVVTALRNAVRNNTVSHAYLFSGPRGTGKTSTARILAKALNCENPQDGEPCCECESCVDMEAGRSFDLFELDAASNNGVDAIRDLVDRAAVGSPGRTKVYILDEVHMLSTAASNALLKTLEEPPGHVCFVLATTDPQKVLPTIKSRTQHYEFQLLGASELEEYVRWIIADADLSVDDEAIRWSVRQGKGSARDTLSALDQVVAAGGVVERVEPVDALLVALAESDPGAAIKAVADALNLGHDPRVLGRALLDSLRDLFLLSLDAPVPHLVPDDVARLGEWATRLGTPMLTRSMDVIGGSLVEMRNAADPRVPLEVALIRLTRGDADSIDGLIARIEKLEAALEAAVASGSGGPVHARASGNGTDRSPTAGRADVSGRAGGPGRAARAGGPERAGGPDRADVSGRPTAPLESLPVPPAGGRGAAAAAPPVPPSAASTARNESSAGASASDTSSPSAAPSSGESASARPSAEAAGSATTGSLSVDGLNSTLFDKVVPSMKGVAKAIYSQGRFVSVDGDVGVYLVENAPTRDRAEKSRQQVEELLGKHLGTAITVRITDSAADGASSGGSRRDGSARSGPTADARAPGTGREPNDHGGPGSHRPPGAPMSEAVIDEQRSAGSTDAAGSTNAVARDDGRPEGAARAPTVPRVPPVPAPPPVPSGSDVPSGASVSSVPPVPAPPPTPGGTTSRRVPRIPTNRSTAARAAGLPPEGPRSDGSPSEPPPDDEAIAYDDIYMDVHELEDATDVASTGLERLLEAFPGATVIEQDTEVR